MKKKWIFGGVIAGLMAAAAFYLWLPGSVPQGQKPMVELKSTEAAQFDTAFDAAKNMPRLVLLLSPT